MSSELARRLNFCACADHGLRPIEDPEGKLEWQWSRTSVCSINSRSRPAPTLRSSTRSRQVSEAIHCRPRAPSLDHKVLDVACGSGQFAVAIAPMVSQVVGVDLTPAMLAGTCACHCHGRRQRALEMLGLCCAPGRRRQLRRGGQQIDVPSCLRSRPQRYPRCVALVPTMAGCSCRICHPIPRRRLRSIRSSC